MNVSSKLRVLGDCKRKYCPQMHSTLALDMAMKDFYSNSPVTKSAKSRG